jgi:hypothetical protein
MFFEKKKSGDKGMFLNAKIETDRLVIRPYQDVDAKDIFEMVTEENLF